MMTKRVLGLGIAAALVAAIALAAFALGRSSIPLSSDGLRLRLVQALSEELDADVRLAALDIDLWPRVTITGRGLLIHHRRHPTIPLIAIERFDVASGFRSLWRRHIESVVLHGLAIRIPPRDGRDADRGPDDTDEDSSTGVAKAIVLDDLRADDATLTVLPRRADRDPRVWRLHQLHLSTVALGRAIPFESVLTNAVPPGEIVTQGTFGPWQADDPGATPIAGAFTFDNADLSVFKGIAGRLSAHGDYRGTLERLVADGRTVTPDFMVTMSGQPVSLATTYRAIIDATNGDTTLEEVNATFRDTALVARGGVYSMDGIKGRQLSLAVAIERGQLEDVLALAVNTPKPTMTGGLALTAHVELPPGPVDVVDKLELTGEFRIAGGRFTDPGVQQKISTLSGRARGTPEAPGDVQSDFAGNFDLRGGRLSLQPLRFDVPGAMVQMAGRYGLRAGSLDFAGQVLMQAKLSQSVGGWKGLVLKPFDPLFRRSGQTFIPITISGTRNAPKFGLDRRRIFNKDAPPVLPSRARRSR